MKESEAAELLAIASGFDRRQSDRLTTRSWALALSLAGVEYQPAQDAIIAHFVGPLADQYLTVAHVVNAARVSVRGTVGQIAADVRSARGRGLVPSDWSERVPVPADVLARLSDLREVERSLVPDLLAVGGDVGDVGRRP